MRKLKDILTRIFSASFSRMVMCVRRVKQDSGRPGLRIFADMVFCFFRYGMGYLDYLTLGFVYLSASRRKTYMNQSKSHALSRKLNRKAFKYILDDKLEFNKRFQKELGRGFIDLRESGPDGFRTFADGKTELFVKKITGYGGRGVRRVEIDGGTDLEKLFLELTAAEQFDVEEALVQHEVMNRLAGSSVNSLRMVTVLKDGTAHLMYTLVRVSDGESYVDNISSGGMYAPVNGNGVVTAPAFRDFDGCYYDRHPKTGTAFEGFQIPFYSEAAELVKKAAKTLPELRFVGWDVAVTKEGPALIEGNALPGYDMCQNYRHIGAEKQGSLPAFRAVLKEESV